ncbi:MAG: serine hydrolase domain-containing protein [Imperialibacter sp.]|uniref:serine hydrolase domain-containing protein n=1 Tax=Imperialibacter sp. TaxID=2038411 RepID=UPI0032EB8ACB
MKLLTFPALLCFLTLYSCSTSTQVGDGDAAQVIENSLVAGMQIKGEPVKTYTLAERMAHYNVPGVSIAVVKDGKISWARGYGTANSHTGSLVDVNTLFQAGSISKPIAALAALKLAGEGKVELDADVNTYLTSWKVPDSEFTQTEKVTLRRLLTHTAGTTVHGFPGYHPSMIFPGIETVLNGRGNTPAIYVDTTPGTLWRYSGGGYTIMEKVVEDVTDLPLDIYLKQSVLEPLGMEHSTYAQPLPADRAAEASAAYDSNGTLIDGLWHNYPEQAAAGLWTTPSDLAKYCIEIQSIVAGKKGGILSQEMVTRMLTKDKNDWGLGPSLKNDGDDLIFQHGGKNAGFTNNMVAFAHKGEAIIIMTNADNGGRLIGEIINAASDYYDWGLSNVRTIETIKLSSEKLQEFVGKYQYSEQVPGSGSYYIEVRLTNGQLTVIDPEENSSFSLTPTEAMKFIDLEKGDQIVFSASENSPVVLLWNNNYRFYKVE